MFSKIFPRSIIVYVCDMSNFEGSQVPELYNEIQKKHHRLIFVGNKIDTLPSGFSIDRLSLWVKNEIKKKVSDPEVIENMTICLTSAKKLTGVQKILTVLEKTKN